MEETRVATVLGKVEVELARLLDTRNLYVALYDDKRNWIQFVFAKHDGKFVVVGAPDCPLVYRDRPFGDGLSEYVIRSRKPLLIEDNFDERAQALGIKTFPIGTKCWLGAPMIIGGQRLDQEIVGGKVLGIIGLQNFEHEYVFDKGHLNVLSTVANQAAIALYNAQLYDHITQDLDRRIRELEVLNKIGQTVSTLGIDQILDLVYEQIAKIVDLSDAQVQIAFYDEKRDEVSFPLAIEQDNGVTIDVIRWSKREADYREVGEFRFSVELGFQNDLEKGTLSEAFRREFKNHEILLSDDITITKREKKKKEKGTFWQVDDKRQLYIAVEDESLDVYEAEDAVVEQFKPRARRDPPGLTEHVIRTKQPLLIVEDFEQKAKDQGIQVWPTFGRFERPTHSWLGVPMMVGGRVIGIISIQSLERERAFDEEHQELLTTVASQAAVAIENARRLDRETRWAQQLAGLQEIGVKIASQLELGDVLDSIVENVNRVMSADFATLFLYDSEQDKFKNGVRKGKVEVAPSIPSSSGFSARIAKTQESVFVEDAEKEPGVKPTFIQNKRVKSFAGVPLVMGEKTVGILYVNYLKPHSFSEEEQETIRLLASQAAVAIENARLYEELEQTLKELRETQEKMLVAEVNAAVGLVTAEVAHHSKNLAGIIRACVTRLRQQLQDLTAQQQEDLENILFNSEGILKAAEDLFKPFRAEPKAEISVNLMLREALGVVCGLPDIENINIQVNPVLLDLPRVNVQVQKVTTYVTELLNNAVKFSRVRMEEEGIDREQIEVDGRLADDGFVELTFTNHGPVIPRERWEEIFKLFSARETDEQEARGYGLGLWGARTTMRAHGGDVYVLESNEKRTTFLLRLPTQQEGG